MRIKKKIIISIVAVVIITSGIIYFVILPTIKDIRKISRAVYLERVDLEKKYLRGQLLRKTIDDFDKIKPDKEKLSSIFITVGEELKFITALEKIATQHNLEQEIKLQQNKNEQTDSYYTLPLSITARGNFIEILKYLKELEKLNYYFNVFSLSASADSKNQGSKDVTTFTLTGEVYSLPTEKETGT